MLLPWFMPTKKCAGKMQKIEIILSRYCKNLAMVKIAIFLRKKSQGILPIIENFGQDTATRACLV